MAPPSLSRGHFQFVLFLFLFIAITPVPGFDLKMQLPEQYIGKLRRPQRSVDGPLGEGSPGRQRSRFGLCFIAIHLRVLHVVQIGAAGVIQGLRQRKNLL